MNLLLLFALIPFYSHASNLCEFKAEVTPSEREEEARAIYDDMCNWFIDTFPDKPLQPDITLNRIIFIDSWEQFEEAGQNHNLYAIFINLSEKK